MQHYRNHESEPEFSWEKVVAGVMGANRNSSSRGARSIGLYTGDAGYCRLPVSGNFIESAPRCKGCPALCDEVTKGKLVLSLEDLGKASTDKEQLWLIFTAKECNWLIRGFRQSAGFGALIFRPTKRVPTIFTPFVMTKIVKATITAMIDALDAGRTPAECIEAGKKAFGEEVKKTQERMGFFFEPFRQSMICAAGGGAMHPRGDHA